MPTGDLPRIDTPTPTPGGGEQLLLLGELRGKQEAIQHEMSEFKRDTKDDLTELRQDVEQIRTDVVKIDQTANETKVAVNDMRATLANLPERLAKLEEKRRASRTESGTDQYVGGSHRPTVQTRQKNALKRPVGDVLAEWLMTGLKVVAVAVIVGMVSAGIFAAFGLHLGDAHPPTELPTEDTVDD